MRVDVVSLFPDFIAQCAAFGVVGRAQERGLLSLHGWNPRDYATGNYRRVDDRPFGGGPGRVMLIDPAVIAFGMVARVPAMDRQQAALAGTPDHAVGSELGDEFGEQADDVDAHQKSGSQSTVTRPASKSTDLM